MVEITVCRPDPVLSITVFTAAKVERLGASPFGVVDGTVARGDRCAGRVMRAELLRMIGRRAAEGAAPPARARCCA